MAKLIFILGPTASGKSQWAIKLAKKFKGEIINADARQVYQGLDYGSGKITKKERQIVPHHLIDIASPLRNFSAGQWLAKARKIIKKLSQEGKIIIVSGGTLFYIKGLLFQWNFPSAKPDYQLRKKLEKFSTEKLFEKLKKLDPQRAKTIDPHNKRRLIRALEIIIKTKKKIPLLVSKPIKEKIIIAIDIPWSELQRKIKKRLKDRLNYILKEIKQLRKKLSWQRIISFGLEYKWFGKYLKGEISLKEAEEKCLKDIFRFAKKQIKEIKKLPKVHWVKSLKEAEEIINQEFFHNK